MTIHFGSFKELKLQGLTRDFGAVRVLRNVDLTIKQGEFIALLGPSGCGKTTALSILAGLLPASSGSIWLDETRIDPMRPEQRGFGMVFQNYALFPHMNVRKNIGFGLTMRGIPKDEISRRVEDAIALVRLQKQEEKLPGQLSGGQQQRVAIARAIVVEPPLVLMDEPLSNLDAKLRLEMRAEIRRIHNTLNSTTIYVTHDQEEALSLADRIVVMRDGVVRQVGTPEDLYHRPRHLDVAEFMGFRNRITGKIATIEGDMATIEAEQTVLSGILRERAEIGSIITAAIRPDDLQPVEENCAGIKAIVTSAEFRGREYFGFAQTSDGVSLTFRAEKRLAAGDVIRLGASAEKVLLFQAEGS